MRVFLEAKSYKVQDIKSTSILPGVSHTKYTFKHKSGKGVVSIQHSKKGDTIVDWDSPGAKKGDPSNARRILRTVEKVVRYHTMKNKSRSVSYQPSVDNHDMSKPGNKNRRDAIYSRILRRYKKAGWKEGSGSSPDMRTFKRAVKKD